MLTSEWIYKKIDVYPLTATNIPSAIPICIFSINTGHYLQFLINSKLIKL